MATKTAVKPAFTVTQAEVLGRTAHVVLNAEGVAVAITFSAKKADKIVAFRTTQLSEVG